MNVLSTRRSAVSSGRKLPEQTGHRLDAVLGLRPRKGDWSDLWIERHREAPSDLG